MSLVIIGTGLAGYHVAKEFRKLDAVTPILLITQDDGSFYSKPMLSNAWAKQKAPAQLVMQSAEVMTQQLNAKILTHTSVEAINPKTKQVITSQGAYVYSQLVLACGASPIIPTFEGAEHLLQVNSLADYAIFRERLAQLKAQLNRPVKIFIIGAGLIGCEFANDLASAEISVHLLDLADQCMPRLLPQSMAGIMQQQLTDYGVQFHLGEQVCSVRNESAEYIIECESGAHFTADIILSAIGLKPNAQLAQQANLTIQQGIVVDEYLKTSADSIYALGDCAQVQGHWLCYVMPLMASARALAKTLASELTPVNYPPMPVMVKTPACPLTVCSPPVGCVGSWSVTGAELNWQGLFYDAEHKLRGFALLGETTQAEKIKLVQQLPHLFTLQ